MQKCRGEQGFCSEYTRAQKRLRDTNDTVGKEAATHAPCSNTVLTERDNIQSKVPVMRSREVGQCSGSGRGSRKHVFRTRCSFVHAHSDGAILGLRLVRFVECQCARCCRIRWFLTRSRVSGAVVGWEGREVGS